MKTFQNLKTKTKLLLGCSGIALGLLMVGGMAISSVTDLRDRIEAIYKINVIPLTSLGELQSSSQRMSALVAWHILAHDSATMKKQMDDIKALDEQIDRFLERYAPIIVTETEQKTFDGFKTALAEYKASRSRVLDLSDAFSKDAANELQSTELGEKLAVMLEKVHGLVKENEIQAQEHYESSRDAATRFITLMGAVIAGAFLVGLFINWAVSRFMIGGLQNILEATRQLQKGNLTFRATVGTKEELGALSRAFNQMADELAQSMTKQQEAIEEMNARVDIMNTTSIVSEANLKGEIISANDKFVEVSKYSKEELLGKPHNITRHSDVSKDVFKSMWQTIAQGKLFRGVIKNRAKDGTPYYVDAVIKPILGADGKPRKYLGVRYEITEYEVARHNMKGILDAIDKSYVTVECDLKGTIKKANGQFLQTMGYSGDEINGKHHRMLVDPSYGHASEYLAFWEKLGRGGSEAGQYKWIAKNGREVWLRASFSPVMDEVGRPFKVIGLATDITQEKQALAEVEKLIKAASVGQLSQRIKSEMFTGGLRELTDSVNRLVDSVTQPLHEAKVALSALASNDLTQNMTGTYHGEFDDMKTALNLALGNLSTTITSVRHVVKNVLSGSEAISNGHEDLSRRTSQQAAALEETSASMEEMTATVKQNADNAKRADQLAIAARETADRGGLVTRKAVDAMGEINKSSKKIADITTVIDEIAFQTNLLALNAAVEAARAGEHGRGFAVVATEVRNLAQRSAMAAKEITGLIQESLQSVTEGTELVNASGKTLEEVVHSVKRVTDIIAEISAASQEQAIGIDQVNKAIISMDQATQQNVGLVDQTTSSAQTMTEQAKDLLRQVDVFTVASSEHHPAHHTPIQQDTLPPVGGSAMKTVDHAHGTQMARPKPTTSRSAVHKEPVGAAIGKGKDRHGVEGEFEEF
ncbi:MAG: MCP four helix bundle domain-containing protein [Nitrospira sp.]|nr:MCP four helix bundle domain-containing protein [Nitrospira sp.]